MRKRTYRAVRVKDFDWQSLDRLAAKYQRLLVGIDVAKRVMFAAFMTPDGQLLGVIKWRHLLESREVISRFKELGCIEAVMEPSGTYGDALELGLRTAGISTYRVHPKQTKDAHEIYDGVPSTHDAKCSALLAWLHLLGRSAPWREASPHDRALSAAVRLLDLHAKAFQQARNQLEAVLARHWPELADLLVLGSVSMLELLHAYGSPQAVVAAPAAARKLLQRAGRNGLSQAKIEAVLESACSSLGIAPLAEEREALRELAQEALHRLRAKQGAERRLQALSEREPSTKCLSAQVGSVTASVLYQGLGSLLNYSNTGSLLKAAGLNLREHSSGLHQGRLQITKRGSRRVRRYLYLAVLRWVHQDPWARAWHRHKVQRDGGRVRRKSLIALMRKLLKGLFWVARGERFDSTRLFDTSRLSACVEA